MTPSRLQVIQPKRFDMTSFPHSVKIKYPIKPINGISHQSSGGYSGYNKFHNRQAKPNYQVFIITHNPNPISHTPGLTRKPN